MSEPRRKQQTGESLATQPRHLELVADAALMRVAAPPRVPSLRAQPFRPGELPEILHLELSTRAANRVTALADRTAVPVELWIRVAIEAGRHAYLAAEGRGLSRAEVDIAVDRASEPSEGVAPVLGRRQLAYARKLRAGEPARGSTRDCSIFSLRVPDQLAAGWAFDAARGGLSLGEWAERHLACATETVHTWEAASAERGYSLGEWIWQCAAAAASGKIE